MAPQPQGERRSGANVLMLDPEDIILGENSRFALKPYRIESLKQSILENGGVNTPVQVRPVNGGTQYELIAGYYRHAAVASLNKEQAAGLKIPAIPFVVTDDIERLRRQLTENMERENQSPMDMAVAAKKLLDAGVSRADVRRIFSRPGGRKGLQLQPASNSWLNITLGFLDYPKKVQNLIHDGVIGVAAAYELGRVPADKREAVVDRAIKAREAELAREEREEEKLAKVEEKAGASQAKIDEAKAAADEAVAAKAAADELVKAAKAKVKEAGQLDGKDVPMSEFSSLPDKTKKEIAERIGAAKADLRGAEKEWGRAVKEADKLTRRYKALVEPEAEEEAPKAKAKAAKTAKAKPAKKSKGVSSKEVREAAKGEGVEVPVTPMRTAVEFKGVAAELTRSKFATVRAIGKELMKTYDGLQNAKEAEVNISVLTGERKKAKA